MYSVSSNSTSYQQMSHEWNFHLAVTFTLLITANSLVNPIMYAVRMAEFRKIVSQLFQRSSGRRVPNNNIQLKNRNIMIEFNCRLAGNEGGF